MKLKIIYCSILIFIFIYNSLFIYSAGTAYGYKLGVGPCQLVNPTYIRILSYQGADYFAGASWANGKWFAITHLTHKLIICDTITGQNTIIGNIGTVSGDPVALCWDPTVSKMYMLTAYPNNLYTVNINTGADSLIGSIDLYPQYDLIAGAIANNGSFYGVLHTGDNSNPLLLKINKNTGQAQLRGIMYGGANQGPQGIAFDRRPGGFFWWPIYRPNAQSILMHIDTVTAFLTLNAVYPDSTHICGFIITDNLVGVKNISAEIPSQYTLNQNYPNPFNPVTKIQFSLPKQENIKLVIFDILGRETQTVINKEMNAGTYEIEWDGIDYPSGIYYYTLYFGDQFLTKKMVLVK
jgi:hypothetical protein